MSFTKFSDLLPEVAPFLKADPSSPFIESAIKAATIEFCNKSWVWRHFPDALDVVAGESTYQLEPAPNTDVAAVLSCSFDGQPISPRASDELDTEIPTWRTESGTVEYFTQVNTEEIILARVPSVNVAAGLVMTLAVQPRRASTSFPRWIASQYAYDIAAGAIARIMGMPDRPWSDPKSALGYRSRFDNAIAAARESAIRGLSRAPTRTASYH